MMAVLVLLVLVMVVFQLSISASTDARIARNQTTLSNMDYAIESALMRIMEDLAADAEADSSGGAGGGGLPGGIGGGGGGDAGGGDAAAGGGGQATDSSRDEWASVDRQDINEIELRVLYQDEDSKYNLLALLTEDEDEARKAYDRVVRILDLCREGTEVDIDPGEAEEMVDAMLQHMQRREESILNRPVLLTDDEEEIDIGLPMSLREFVVLEPFDESHFRDFRDGNGIIVHSIGSFLTIWTSLSTFDEVQAAPGSTPSVPTPEPEPEPQQDDDEGDDGEGGGDGRDGGDGASPETPDSTTAAGDDGTDSNGPQININRAPPVVLKALMDERDVPSTFFDALIEYRNEEDEEASEQDDDDEPVYDEFGEELIIRQIFNSIDDMSQLDGWETLEPIAQAELRGLTKVSSDVFSVFITARQKTGVETQTEFWDREAIEEEEQLGLHLQKTVRCVLWRRSSGQDVTIVPLTRWEVLDYAPYEVVDFPEEGR